jgi:hypothetical protein
MVRMVRPAYAQLGEDVLLSFRPSQDKVSLWHVVRVRNGRMDNFQSIADEHQVPAARLIEFNFPGSMKNGRVDPDVVNWYLHHHREFRCQRTTTDGNNYVFSGSEKIAVPFLGRVEIGDPILPGDRIARMTFNEKVGEAMQRSLPYLPENAKSIVQSLLTPESLALIGATLAVWAGSHFFGIGEIVDVVLLVIGAVTVGFAVFEGSSEFYEFTKGAMNARSVADLDVAGQHFARSVTLLGIATVQGLLLRGQAKAVIARGIPKVRPRIKVGAPPAAGNQLQLTRPAQLPGGSLGETTAYGAIRVARNQSLTEQRLTLFHELVHRFFSPRAGPFQQIRAELRMSAYARSALLKYLEEALAEGYGQLQVHGLAQALDAIRFPLAGGYVTVSQLAAEGTAIGTIVLGGTLFRVSISMGTIPEP